MEGAVTRRRAGPGSIDVPVSIYCAFDADAQRYRFDRSELVRPAPTGEVGVPPPDASKTVTGGGKYVETPERVIAWNAEFPKYVRYYPVGYPRRHVARFINPFDPRILGLANWIIVSHDSKPNQLVPSFRKRLVEATATVSEPRPGLIRVRWLEKRQGLEIDFDRAVGYMPVRYADILSVKAGVASDPIVSAVTTWQARGGVYVPVTARFQDGRDDAPDLQRYDLKLTWDVVNGPVDEALFTARGMGLPKGTLITDNTTNDVGSPLGKVGDLTPDPKLAVVENTPVPAPIPGPPPPNRPWLWPSVGAAVAVAAGALAWWRLRRPHRHDP